MTFPKFVLVPSTMEETKVETMVETNGGVNGGVNEVLKCIEQNPGIRSKELKGILQIKQRTLQRYLGLLKSANKINFIGSPKTGGYHVLVKDK